jgi:hypothetical protein
LLDEAKKRSRRERRFNAKRLTSRETGLPLVEQPASCADGNRCHIVRPHFAGNIVGVQECI